MPKLISYAQNFEDVILWRALKHVQEGYYVDIGAQSPDTDSVGRVFFEQGWRGFHVEPMPHYAAQLRDRRPGDSVLQAAISDGFAVLRFFEIAETGLSTLDETIAREHARAGFSVVETLVPSVTMDSLLQRVGNRPIHWLKIDVEGAERLVLEGWKSAPQRPWILVIESTRPLSGDQVFQKWESLVVEKGYRYCYSDGLNRFYVSNEHPELLAAFDHGPSIFDDFSLASSSEFCAAVNIAYSQLEQLRQQERQQSDLELAGLRADLDAANTEIARLEVRVREERLELESEVASERQRVEELNAQCAEHVDTVRLLTTEVEKGAANLQLERARLSAIRESNSAQIDRFQMHIVWLDGLLEEFRSEKASAEAQLVESGEAAHRWWLEAEALRSNLMRLQRSHSWRVTAPLRSLRRRTENLVRSPRSTFKRAARRYLVLAMKSALAVPYLRERMPRLLGMHPKLKARLRSIGLQADVIQRNAEAAPIGSTGHVGALVLRGVLPAAPPARVAQVLEDLRRAIQERRS